MISTYRITKTHWVGGLRLRRQTRQQNNHCNSCHSGRALVGRNCKARHDGMARRDQGGTRNLESPIAKDNGVFSPE